MKPQNFKMNFSKVIIAAALITCSAVTVQAKNVLNVLKADTSKMAPHKMDKMDSKMTTHKMKSTKKMSKKKMDKMDKMDKMAAPESKM